MIASSNWHEMRTISRADPTKLHCLSMGLLSNCQNFQYSGRSITLTSSMPMYKSVMRKHTLLSRRLPMREDELLFTCGHMEDFSNHLNLESRWAFEPHWITFMVKTPNVEGRGTLDVSVTCQLLWNMTLCQVVSVCVCVCVCVRVHVWGMCESTMCEILCFFSIVFCFT